MGAKLDAKLGRILGLKSSAAHNTIVDAKVDS